MKGGGGGMVDSVERTFCGDVVVLSISIRFVKLEDILRIPFMLVITIKYVVGCQMVILQALSLEKLTMMLRDRVPMS